MAAHTLSATETLAALTAHTWTPQPEPARLVHRLLNECLADCPFAAGLSQQMLDLTGTRMLDWIDHFGLAANDEALAEVNRVGYVKVDSIGGEHVWNHAGGLFPRIRELAGTTRTLAIKVDSVADFLFAHALTMVPIEGEPLAPLRRARVASGPRVEFRVVERHGSRDFVPAAWQGSSSGDTSRAGVPLAAIARHSEALRLRRRVWDDDASGIAHANELIDAAIADLGCDRACELFFAAEREYWQHRNHAGRLQLARQQVLGLGWANHDHHTYRSSRESFAPLIAFCEKLGFQCRERFYAGREAGWGAQVIEHPVTGVIIFADVDLSPEELAQDFSHEPLAKRNELGTVGLWCALHGEAFLQAGMHHLECQFDFAATRDQLKQAGIDMMPPFTDFPYLRQAFTRGEQWSVSPERVERLRSAKRITDEQAEQFLQRGALGSHLEILQRNDGYKGFNQRGINEIIAATDPRRAAEGTVGGR
jgi:hypothetical protein